MVRTGAGRLLVGAALLAACAGPARAATLALDAPDGCVDRETLSQEVADLVGRPLAEVPDLDFQLTISPRGPAWHLQLQAVEHSAGDDAHHLRQLDAASCPDLAEAAAVAISVSIRAMEEQAPPVAAPAARPPAAVPPGPNASPIPVVAAPPAPRLARPPLQAAMTAALAADSGELPGTGLAVLAGVGIDRGPLRLAASVGWAPARETAVSTTAGGRFQLVFGALDGCFAPLRRTWSLLGCLGAELGAYSAVGFGIPRPSSRTGFWRAGRAGIRVVRPLTGEMSLVLEATVVVPLVRPQFVLDETQAVYKPASVAERLGAGLEFGF